MRTKLWQKLKPGYGIIIALAILFSLFVYNKNVNSRTDIKKSVDMIKPAQEGMNRITRQLNYISHYQGTSNINTPKTLHHDRNKTQFRKMNDVDPDIASIFEQIAQTQSWGGGNETISGLGSIMDSTITLRKCLGNWIIKYNFTSIVDIPCGDSNWQHAIPGIENVYYRGYDVSKLAIERAKGKNPKWTFGLLDVTRTIPPKADLIIMRDFLQHLPLDIGKKALINAFKSNSIWLGVSTFPKTSSNTDIKVGAFYRNNVLKTPFNLPMPAEICDNYSKTQARSFADSTFYLIKL